MTVLIVLLIFWFFYTRCYTNTKTTSDWLEQMRNDTEQIRRRTERIREQTERLRRENEVLRSLTPDQLSEIVKKSTRRTPD